MPTEIRLVALYYKEMGLKPKQRREKLYEFCKKNISGYKVEKYYKVIDRALRLACKKEQKLVQIDSLPIYEKEIDYINTLDIDHNCKKVLFAFLVQMRLNKLVYEYKNENEYTGRFFKGGKIKYNNIKKMSNIPQTVLINEDVIYELNKKDLVKVLHKGLIRLDFLEQCHQEGEVGIVVEDFENAGWYFDYYVGAKGVVLCGYCNSPFKKRTNRQEYCSDECFAEQRRTYISSKVKEHRDKKQTV